LVYARIDIIDNGWIVETNDGLNHETKYFPNECKAIAFVAQFFKDFMRSKDC